MRRAGAARWPLAAARPRVEAATAAADWTRELTTHALSWLVVANAVGLWLATLLLLPQLGDRLAPLTYGRWMPLHLDLQLYGWCALPLVGLLLRLYRPRTAARRAQTDPLYVVTVRAWSVALAVGAVSWLAGVNSGKLYLEWAGAARGWMALTMAGLHLALCWSFLHGRDEQATPPPPAIRSGGARWGKAALLVLLAPVPWIWFAAASPGVYPPVNPASGGPTGVSLLGSVLALVALFCATPWMLGRPLRGETGTPDRRRAERIVRWSWAALAIHLALFGLLGHGDRSHHDPAQWLGLASVVVWVPLLSVYLRRFAWPQGSTRWWLATAGWGGVLTLSGVVTLLPGVLERWKFTHMLVAHAHAAMAGLVTSFLALVLLVLARQADGDAGAFGDRFAFWGWQLGTAVHVAAMSVLGVLEAGDAGIVFRFAPATAAAYGLRWAAGALMLLASCRWLMLQQSSAEPAR
jgi:cytochrome c oxidase cbb3-type subunit 1